MYPDVPRCPAGRDANDTRYREWPDIDRTAHLVAQRDVR